MNDEGLGHNGSDVDDVTEKRRRVGELSMIHGFCGEISKVNLQFLIANCPEKLTSNRRISDGDGKFQ